jgi:hypothetical protein
MKNGKAILAEILKSVGNYIALSMRNIKVSFEMPGDSVFDEDLDCFKWIGIRGLQCKVTGIERVITPFDRRVKVTAIGLESKLSRWASVENVTIEAAERKALELEDVLQDVVVQNDGDEQYSKLLAYISSMKAGKLITKDNYKQLITRFLNENPTKIHVIAKPLKTEHCERRSINIGQPLYFLGGSKHEK